MMECASRHAQNPTEAAPRQYSRLPGLCEPQRGRSNNSSVARSSWQDHSASLRSPQVLFPPVGRCVCSARGLCAGVACPTPLGLLIEMQRSGIRYFARLSREFGTTANRVVDGPHTSPVHALTSRFRVAGSRHAGLTGPRRTTYRGTVRASLRRPRQRCGPARKAQADSPRGPETTCFRRILRLADARLDSR